MNSQAAGANQKHDINPQYDTQDSYGVRESFYGNGKYPPDWDARREAVWERQKYQCGRCGVYKGDSDINEVHHVVHLSQGGANTLDNLVGLCGDCHALMHPTIDALDGNPTRADIFPDEYADDRVAVIRWPNRNDKLEFDLQRLSEISTPDRNSNAVTGAAVPTSAELARKANPSLTDILLKRGFVPRTTDYHRVSIRPEPKNLLAAISRRGVDLVSRGDGRALEVEERTGSDRHDVYLSADTEHAELEIEEPSGNISTNNLSLTHDSGSRLRLEVPVSAPKLSAGTALEYAIDGGKYFIWRSLKIGLLPSLLLVFLMPSLVPDGGSILGSILLMTVVGLLLRLPAIYTDATGMSSERLINERTDA